MITKNRRGIGLNRYHVPQEREQGQYRGQPSNFRFEDKLVEGRNRNIFGKPHYDGRRLA